MRRQTKPRRRAMRDRCRATAGKFYLLGYPADGDNLHPRRCLLTYDNGRLSGDAALVAAAHERAAALGADLTEPLSALALLLPLFFVGVEVGGDVPARAPIRYGAIR